VNKNNWLNSLLPNRLIKPLNVIKMQSFLSGILLFAKSLVNIKLNMSINNIYKITTGGLRIWNIIGFNHLKQVCIIFKIFNRNKLKIEQIFFEIVYGRLRIRIKLGYNCLKARFYNLPNLNKGKV